MAYVPIMFVLVIGIVVGCIGFSKVYFEKSRDTSVSLKLAFSVLFFVISLFCLVVSLKLFWDMNHFVSENNVSPTGGFLGEYGFTQTSVAFYTLFYFRTKSSEAIEEQKIIGKRAYF